MKLTLLFLICLCGCGRNPDQGNKNQADPKYSRQEIRTCGYENSRITALCIPLADYIISSDKALPAKLKISISFEGTKVELFNECTTTNRGDFKVIRNQTSGLVTFEDQRKRYYDGVDLEIVDLGISCDNDAIFFSAFTKPNIQQMPNDRDKAKFNLEN